VGIAWDLKDNVGIAWDLKDNVGSCPFYTYVLYFW
jgi:hypothetical protein